MYTLIRSWSYPKPVSTVLVLATLTARLALAQGVEEAPQARGAPMVRVLQRTANTDERGVMLRGYDPVAYAADERPIKGSARYAVRHDGLTYYFASAINRDTFVAAPDLFVPAFGGFDAIGVAEGRKQDSDPTAFVIAHGTLFVLADAKSRRRWSRHLVEYEAQALRHWQSVSLCDDTDPGGGAG